MYRLVRYIPAHVMHSSRYRLGRATRARLRVRCGPSDSGGGSEADTRESKGPQKKRYVSHRGSNRINLLLLHIGFHDDVEEFKENMDLVLKMLRETKPAAGHDRVLYPGLSEHEEEQDRRANGIPLHKEVIQWFDDITSELSIPRLKTL